MKKLLIIRRVRGYSMSPTLKSGQVVFASGALVPKSGDVVIAKYKNGEVIKRVKSINGHAVELTGDNPSAAHNIRVGRADVIATKLL